ncbi:MAG: choice-of-anchor W domain-containing protein [Planctomycetota bacterium]|nr:choice-of-anchor W domain-containing protein [Planctomycetota bacterium]
MKLQVCSYIAVGVLAAGSSAASAAISIQPLATGDADFLALTNNGALERAVSEGRIGNNADNGTWEQAIWEPQGGVGSPVAQAQLPGFTSGATVPFSISYDGAASISYTFGSSTLTWNLIDGPFTDLFIRVRATSTSTAGLSNMFLDLPGAGEDTLIPDLTTGPAGTAEYLRLTRVGADFPAFTISGSSTFSWTGAVPANSALAYQVKFSNVVPAPGALAIFALAGLTSRRRRA